MSTIDQTASMSRHCRSGGLGFTGLPTELNATLLVPRSEPRSERRRHRWAGAVIVLAALALRPAGALAAANPPFEITEDRPRCTNYDPNRQPSGRRTCTPACHSTPASAS